MSNIKVDKGVPVPEKYASVAKYPFRQLEVGDSFFSCDNKARQAAANYAARNGISVTIRVEVQNGVKGVRVWRTA